MILNPDILIDLGIHETFGSSNLDFAKVLIAILIEAISATEFLKPPDICVQIQNFRAMPSN